MNIPTEDWDAVVDEHAGALIMLARQWTDCHSDAEDVVHEAFLRCWRQRVSVREPVAYLFRAVRNTAMKWRRGETRRQRRQDQVAQECSMLVAGDDPAATVQAEERREAIELAMLSLPVEQREVIVMKIWGELTFADIGDALEISPNTAAGRYRYAIQTLRSRLSEAETAT